MLALKATDVKNNFKAVCARVFNGETVMLSRPKNQNVAMLDESNQRIQLQDRRDYRIVYECADGRIIEKSYQGYYEE